MQDNGRSASATQTTRSIEQMSFWSIEFWKIYAPIMIMMIFGAASYTSIRLVKDATVMNFLSPSSLKILKTSIVIVGVILFNALYSYAIKRFKNRPQVALYSLISIFLIFYLITFLVAPYVRKIQFLSLEETLTAHTPVGLRPFTAIIWEYAGVIVGGWFPSIYYTVTEVYGLAILSMVCWVFANRLIPAHLRINAGFLMNAVSNLCTIFFTQQVKGLSALRDAQFDKQVGYLSLILCVIPLAIILICALYLGETYKSVFASPATTAKKTEKSKSSGSFFQNVIETLRDSYTSKVAILVIAYNFLIAATDLAHKALVCIEYPTKYSDITSNMSQVNGVLSTVLALIGLSLFSGFSWRVKALVPAISLGIPGVVFYAFYIFKDYSLVQFIASLSYLSPMDFVIMTGCILSVLAKATKYTFFDITKEAAMSFFSNLASKGFIDSTVNKLSKSCTNWLMVGIIFFHGLISGFFGKTHHHAHTHSTEHHSVEHKDEHNHGDHKHSDHKHVHHMHGDHHSHKHHAHHSVDTPQIVEDAPAFVHIEHQKQRIELSDEEKAKAIAVAKKNRRAKREMDIAAPYMMIIFAIVACFWIYGVMSLYPQYEHRLAEKKLSDGSADGDHDQIEVDTSLKGTEILSIAGLCFSMLLVIGGIFRVYLDNIFHPNKPNLFNSLKNSLFVMAKENSSLIYMVSAVMLLICIGLWVFVAFASFYTGSIKKHTKFKLRAWHIVVLTFITTLVLLLNWFSIFKLV